MRSKSIKGSSLEEVKNSFQNALEDGYKPTLAFVFSSIEQDWQGVSRYFDSQNIDVFGMSTCSEFTDKGITNKEIAILLLDLNSDYYKIYLKPTEKESLYDSSVSLGEEIKKEFANPGLIVSTSAYMKAGEDIILGLENSLGQDITFFGGRAGDDNTLTGAFVFINNKSSSDAIIVLAIDQNKVAMEGVAISGWKPLGTYHHITKVEGNWIHTIDNEPAMDLILKYTGIELDSSNDTDIFLKIGYSFPLLLEREQGYPIASPMLMVNRENKSVLMGTGIQDRNKFRFSMPPDFDVIDTVVQSAKEVKDGNFPESDALLIFSCAARNQALGPLIESEINGLKDTWGSSMAGTFCYGEFGRPPGGDVEFLGTTCSWVALKEK